MIAMKWLWRALWRALWRVLRAALLVFAAVVLFVEEWGWQPLTAWAAQLGQWPPLRSLEGRIQAMAPRRALLLFLVPAIALFPIKLLALWLIHLGHRLLGIAVIVAAKLLGTALVGRLFILTEPQLMQFGWFARSLGWWRATKEIVRARVYASPMAQALRRGRLRMRRVARGVSRRFARYFGARS